jgi:hypothetical protein
MVSAPAQRGRPETVGRSEGDRPLPVLPALEPLFPAGGLRRGSAVAVRGSASLLLALLAGPSGRGAWCGVVGVPGLGLAAAAEAGIALERLALVPDPGRDWAAVAAALLDAMEVVVVAPRGRVPDADARRLAARARQRGAVLVPFGPVPWPGAELRLSLVDGIWEGLGDGSGRLRSRRVVVRGDGRGSAARGHELALWLPGPDGQIRAVPALHALPTPPDHAPTPAPTPHLHAVPTPPSPPPTPGPAAAPPTTATHPAASGEPGDGVGVLRAPARRSSSPGGPGEPAQPVIAALWQDVTHRPGARPPVVRRSDGPAPTHPRPVGPPRRTLRTPPARTAATPVDRPGEPAARTASPTGAHRDPAARTASPAGAHRDPAAPTVSPADRPRDPAARTVSPTGAHREPHATSPVGGRPVGGRPPGRVFADGGSRPRPAGPPVPAGRPAPVGGGHPAPPPPAAGLRPAIPADVLARLRPASTLPKPPPKQSSKQPVERPASSTAEG